AFSAPWRLAPIRKTERPSRQGRQREDIRRWVFIFYLLGVLGALAVSSYPENGTAKSPGTSKGRHPTLGFIFYLLGVLGALAVSSYAENGTAKSPGTPKGRHPTLGFYFLF